VTCPVKLWKALYLAKNLELYRYTLGLKPTPALADDFISMPGWLSYINLAEKNNRLKGDFYVEN
jgi:hypothetical protein